MPNRYEEDRETQIIGGGYGGGYGAGGGGGFGAFGGIFAMIILLVVLLWLLFRGERDGGRDGGNGGNYVPYPYPAYAPPYGGGGNCSPYDCKIKMTPDMSICEVDRDLWKVDADLLKCCCEQKEVTHAEAEATRAVMYADKVEALRDKLAEKSCEIQALKTQAYTDAKFDTLNAQLCRYDNQIDKQFYKTDAAIAALNCKIPDRRPIYCDGVTPVTRDIDCCDFPRRGHREEHCGCGCGCN